jgi:hypothetical protein
LLNRQAERTEVRGRWQLQRSIIVDAVPAPVGIALTVVETLGVGEITFIIVGATLDVGA